MRETSVDPAPCLDANVAVAFAAGRLSEAELRSVESHVDACSFCRQLLASTAQSSPSGRTTGSSSRSAPSTEAVLQELLPRSAIGRYVIEKRVGAGGMGVVYAARDSELDRRVALKVVRTGLLPSDRMADDLLRREAMAMARLSHRNVVSVYDLFCAQDATFIAMELIEGVTLREWLRDRSRSWREVLGALVAAGRGLSAAHAAGVVHRDFKPENVLCGPAGRVCVSDFGLSRSATEPAGTEPATTAAAPAEAGASTTLVGTPHYMSPEQRAGKRATARSDQFSFCVVAYEALYGRRPGDSASNHDDAERTGRGWRGPGAPVHVRRALARGLNEEPDQRYASMDELLVELARDNRAKRAWVGAFVVSLAAGAVVTLAWHRAQIVRREVCAHADRSLIGVWDDQRRESAASAFDHVPGAYGAEAWSRVRSSMDRYAQEWVRTETQACTAALERAPAARVAMDPRLQCLDDRLRRVRAVADELPRVTDPDRAAGAVLATESLEPLESCSRPLAPATSAPSHADPAALDALRSDLARLEVLGYLGLSDEQLAVATRARDAAQTLGAPRWVAEALLALADAHARTWKLDDAQEDLYRAESIADAAGDDVLRARALIKLVYYVGYAQGDSRQAERLYDRAMAALERMGGDLRLEARLRASHGSVLRHAGKLGQAQAELERAIQIDEGRGDRVRSSLALGSLANVYADQGDLDAAVRCYERALPVLEQALGANNPNVAMQLENMADIQLRRRDFEAAFATAGRAGAAFDVTHAKGALSSEGTRVTQGEALLELRRYSEALPLFQASLSAQQGDSVAPNRLGATVLVDLGRAHVLLHDPVRALPLFERALASPAGLEVDDLVNARFGLARALTDLGRTPGRAASLTREAKQALDAKERLTPLQQARRDEIATWLAARPSSAPSASP